MARSWSVHVPSQPGFIIKSRWRYPDSYRDHAATTSGRPTAEEAEGEDQQRKETTGGWVNYK